MLEGELDAFDMTSTKKSKNQAIPETVSKRRTTSSGNPNSRTKEQEAPLTHEVPKPQQVVDGQSRTYRIALCQGDEQQRYRGANRGPTTLILHFEPYQGIRTGIGIS